MQGVRAMSSILGGAVITAGVVCSGMVPNIKSTGTRIPALSEFTQNRSQTTQVLMAHEIRQSSIKNLEMFGRINDFRSLAENWNGNGAMPFSEDLIKKAESIFWQLPFAPDVFPTGRNSIQFEYEKTDGEYLEFEVFEDNIGVYQIKSDGSENDYCIKTNTEALMQDLVKGFYE